MNLHINAHTHTHTFYHVLVLYLCVTDYKLIRCGLELSRESVCIYLSDNIYVYIYTIFICMYMYKHLYITLLLVYDSFYEMHFYLS